MAEYSGFFNSVGGDRVYAADFFAKFFGSFIGNGIFPNPSTNCQILEDTAMAVTYSAGIAWINGYFYISDQDETVTLAAADAVLKRIDRLVLRYTVADRRILFTVKEGVFSSSPVATALQRDADVYEIGLADVYVGAGAVEITQANITDLRLNNTYCGIVHGLIDQADTTTIFNQYQAALTGLETDLQADWDNWFTAIQNVLDGDTAGNLLNMINDNADVIAGHTLAIAENTSAVESIDDKLKKLRMGAI